MKEGDENFERWVSRGVGVAFVLSAVFALIILVGLGLGVVWLWKEVVS